MDGRQLGTILVCVALLGCASKPVTAPRAVVPESAPSELRAAATAGKRFGHMVAIGVGVSNGAAKDYVISADRVLAVDRDGNRVAPLSVAEAARQAGGATALVAGLKGAGAGAVLAGVVAAIPGAVIGAAEAGGRGAGTGAAVGAGIGAAVGAVGGFYTSKTETAPSTSMAQWNRRPGTLPKPAPASSSCLITLSYAAGVKPVGRKYIPNAIDALLTKMNRHNFSKDDSRIRARSG